MSDSEAAAAVGEDYYSVLNVPRDAPSEQIRTAYRRLCMLYHPDKHTDPANKELAKEMFPKIQKAFSVLSDDQQRAIYDMYGAAGLTAGTDLAPYYNTVAELKAEYEINMRKREQEKLLSMTHPEGRLELHVDATELFQPEEYARAEDAGLAHIFDLLSVTGMSIHQSVRSQPTSNDRVQFDGIVRTMGNNAGGTLLTSWTHRFLSGRTLDTTVGIGHSKLLKIKVEQPIGTGSQVFAEVTGRAVNVQGHSALAFGLNLGAVRQLTNHVYGVLNWRIGLEPSMSTSLYYSKAGGVQVSGTVTLAGVHLSGKVSTIYPLTDHTQVKLEIETGTKEHSIGYGIEYAISEHTKFGVFLEASTSDGVTVKGKFRTMRQSYVIPVFLADEVLAEAVAYGTVVPLVTFFAIRQFVVKPWLRLQEHQQLLERRSRYKAVIERHRREAMAAVRLMQETVERKIAAEESVPGGGLIIIQAWYGQLVTSSSSGAFGGRSSQNAPASDAPIIDVTVALQCMVKDSALELHATSKASLVGFYDPCIDEPKQLRVLYKFRGRMHEVTVQDSEKLRIPLQSHLRPES